ncbi:MAG TPA: hypothetical protein VF532_14795 [Candidatus Angelobacter sp.]
MPAGPAPAGFFYFTGVKFLGYTGYAYLLRDKLFDDMASGGMGRTFKIGGTRTAIGVAAGLAYGALTLFTHVFGNGDKAVVFYFLGLLPVRVAEWWLLLWLFFRAKMLDRPTTALGISLGTGVSYLLDAIGIAAALVLPGGIWVC